MADVGISLPQTGGVAFAAHAEAVGLESVWVGDHLIARMPILDSTLVLAGVAATTTRVKIGFGVLVVALRPVVWAAKQVATLQHLSGNRVLLGVGAGGEAYGDAAWRAVGVPYAERGQRTDRALRLLPSLVEGRETDVDGERVTLAPAAPMPPVLVGGGKVGRRRAAEHGDAWMPAFVTPRAVAAGVRDLAELAAKYDRPVPSVTVSVRVALGDQPASAVDQGIRALVAYGLSEVDARNSMITGSPAQAAEKLAELAEAGATRVVGMPFADDRPRQAELLAEAARLAF